MRHRSRFAPEQICFASIGPVREDRKNRNPDARRRLQFLPLRAGSFRTPFAHGAVLADGTSEGHRHKFKNQKRLSGEPGRNRTVNQQIKSRGGKEDE